MKRIENFILPEHTNTLYEKEAISSISLTKDVAKKINELVNAYNELSKEDLEWKQTQEGIIRKGVVYMKDNLLNSLNDLMVLLRDSGFIDDRIEYHCGELKSHLNNESFNIKGVAHRGLSSQAPENTIPAYREAKKNGFYYVECDVRFTSDNKAVLLHDSTVDRTSNGTGNISNMTLSEVRSLDFGSWFNPDYEGEKIPTFEEFIILCKKIGLHPYIELKTGTEAQITSLYTIVKKCGMRRNVTWIGGSPYITYIHQLDSKANIGIVVESVTANNIAEATRIKTESNYVFMNAHTFTEEEINICINADIPLEVWTINDETTILNLNAYISGVTSDTLHAGVICSNKF